MSLPILSFTIRFEHDTVAARQRARQIARLLGFSHQDQTRISTAVSEIARNAFNYGGGGRVDYLLEGRTAPQLFIIKIADAGPGIADLNTIMPPPGIARHPIRTAASKAPQNPRKGPNENGKKMRSRRPTPAD